MKKIERLAILAILVALITGCQTLPKRVFVPDKTNLQDRENQIRKFDTQDEKKIILASAGVLQDLGFTINRSEMNLGVIIASKDKDATDSGQVALATAAVVLSALGGQSSNAFQTIDDVQKIKVSVVTRAGANPNEIVTRATFQRIIWNKMGQMSKLETLSDPKMYQDFFDKLSKSVFLEAQAI